ncbi:sodium-driven chloride bicarbonate exchanger-like isoform X2 [Physella acuta]|nr:sodium-driven chloride bicarbonate exchanger-like isoform X2 [Physella acuta]
MFKRDLDNTTREQIHQAINAQHVFQHQKSHKYLSVHSTGDPRYKTIFSDLGRSFCVRFKSDTVDIETTAPTNQSTELNESFLKKIPPNAKAASIMVGELDCLTEDVVAFVRLCEDKNIGELTEVPIPTRFIFILLGPTGSQANNSEIGRSMSTMMVDKKFRKTALKAKSRQEILQGFDQFLYSLTALPPGLWDPNIRIDPPNNKASKIARKISEHIHMKAEHESHNDPTLQRTGRLFGGLIADVKRKRPWYASDFKDAFSIQCVASTLYMYLATLTPNITFGGLLGKATDQYMGTMECILAACIVGVLFALFSGQPLNILGSTAPMLILDMILFNFCQDHGLDYLPFRAWIGIWTTILLIAIVAFDLSALVRYITRFTEESFACLIALIFIVEAFTKLFGILNEVPVNTHPGQFINYTCGCYPPNSSLVEVNITWLHELILYDVQNHISSVLQEFDLTDSLYSWSNQSEDLTQFNTSSINWSGLGVDYCQDFGGVFIHVGCDAVHYIADAFFLSVLLFAGTFLIAYKLADMKSGTFFPTWVRQTISDFAVPIAIVSMVGVDAGLGIPTPKLEVPPHFKPTRDDRGWFINPISDKNPFWLIFAAILPALLAVILIFMDQQITAVIVNRKENKLKKGCGYHLDLLVVAICIAICSLLGLPWYVAATVSALAHVMSLKKESESSVPGERPEFLGVREQRVTSLLVAALTGASVLFTSILQLIPMAVLYGVFLVMGVAALKDMQFVDRLLLFFKPAKYQPDYVYLRHVPIKRVHVFTFIQILCLVVLWVFKTIDEISIAFPLMVLGTCFIRKAMDYIFTQRELRWLDDLMPEATKKAKEDELKNKLQVGQEDPDDVLLNDENLDILLELQEEKQNGSILTHRSHASYHRLSQMDLNEEKSFEEGIDDMCLLDENNISVTTSTPSTTDQVLVSILNDDKAS